MALTARQWGAEEIVYSGEKDSKMMESVRDIADRWGGEFKVSYRKDFGNVIKEFDGLKVHLTMYGEPIEEKIDDIDAEFDEDILVVVGAEKVPRKVYTNVDYNVGIGHQPHSEIAALAVFMDRFTDIKHDFEDADIEVVPSEDRKLTEDNRSRPE
ncbi:SpoU rRNA Methylase family enzyme [Candidatus Nanohalococcus occultus]|uniref:tRNA (cytidine(56)-2'-O)-methyltransferase n=1 Tax=Candidatus Nanohalococcus occultus TaxID=2978047 RepID=A0ABY8CG12_9ARCH|nr:SpoU rRNA Methylase family enzyme [Candidatus Nanohaloarchaeota archaeon SVXNc]